ncbi:hypothetical protein C8N46_10929 [Kordia periserrulae]|uniref:Uncharacterized protein n=1 Tax=Kordia periserrulae TaxID=701523 RepID=A0A2T6BTP1_9FLAO|nr:hypothetical protein C8N46_10929 [Kordia periserrulae]
MQSLSSIKEVVYVIYKLRVNIKHYNILIYNTKDAVFL